MDLSQFLRFSCFAVSSRTNGRDFVGEEFCCGEIREDLAWESVNPGLDKGNSVVGQLGKRAFFRKKATDDGVLVFVPDFRRLSKDYEISTSFEEANVMISHLAVFLLRL